ncbi:MAG: hypothetical protein WDM79_15355 [Terricaulis sp.]
MTEEARSYFEAESANAEARDERRFARAAARLQHWLKRTSDGRGNQAA